MATRYANRRGCLTYLSRNPVCAPYPRCRTQYSTLGKVEIGHQGSRSRGDRQAGAPWLGSVRAQTLHRRDQDPRSTHSYDAPAAWLQTYLPRCNWVPVDAPSPEESCEAAYESRGL